MVYLVLGQDQAAKEQNIAEIKSKALPSKESLAFDYQVLHGFKLDNETLQKALLALPVAGKVRLVLIRQADELKADQKTLIAQLYEKAKKSLVVILEAVAIDDKDSLYTKFGREINILSFAPKVRPNVFKLVDEILARREVNALKLLNELLENGDHPLQIIGGMLWKWKNAKNRIPALKFKAGLMAFEQADFNVKRSQLKGEHALEILVVKLCS